MDLPLKALALALALGAPAHSAWELVHKLKTTDLWSVAAHKGEYFAASDDGVLASRDGAATFAATSLTGKVWDLLSDGETLFAATDGKGLQKSVDGGKTWVGAGPTGQMRALIALQGTLYAGGNGSGVQRSEDGGKTWAALNTGLGEQAVYCLAAGGGRLFAGTAKKGVYRAPEQGGPWEPINNGFNGPGAFFLAFDGKLLFAVPVDHKGVIRSTDLGSSWDTDIAGQGTLPYPHSLEAYGSNVFFVNAQDGGVQLIKDGAKTLIHVNQPKSPVQPRYAGVAGGFLFVMDFQNGIWRRPLAEIDLAPVSVRLRPPAGAEGAARQGARGPLFRRADGRISARPAACARVFTPLFNR